MEEKEKRETKAVASKVKIGNVILQHPVVLCPMAGVTDLSYREICEEMGAGLTVTEMVSAKALLYGNRNTEELMMTGPEEVRTYPVALQLFGSDPGILADMAERVQDRFSIIDVNMGCPVPKVVNNHEGSDLMRHPELAYDILSSLTKRLRVPVTVKFRKGFTEAEANAPEFAKMAEAAGVSAITVHGRTREQYYAGKADWDIIRRCKEAVKIPVIGNGDIFSPEDARHMMEETGCDAVGIGRGAQGDPWLIGRTVEYLETGRLSKKPGNAEIVRMIRRHMARMAELKGEFLAVREMRKHISWYTAGLPNSGRLRAKINTAESLGEMDRLIERLVSFEAPQTK